MRSEVLREPHDPAGGAEGSSEQAPQPRRGSELILATRPFEAERPLRSWFELLSTLLPFSACIALVVATPWLAVQLPAALLAGALQFRLFAIYHDHHHGSLLPRSTVMRCLMVAFGI